MKSSGRKGAMSVEKDSVKVRKTAMKKCRRRSSGISGRPSSSSASATEQVSASRASELSSSRLHDQASITPMLEPVTDFWIMISNVHTEAAHEDLIRVLFEKCGKLRGQFFQFDSNGFFKGTIYLVYERKDESKEAVALYHNNITLFGKTWRVQIISKRQQMRCCKIVSTSSRPESCDVASSSTRPMSSWLRSSTVAGREVESSSSILCDAMRTLSLQDSAAGIRVKPKVCISNIDAKVPSEFIQLLFEKIGIMRSGNVHIDSSGKLLGTAQVEYEHIEDATAAVQRFSNSITFFGNTWGIGFDINELHQPLAINKRSSAKGKQKVH